MDIISGVTVVTATFMVAMGLVAVLAPRFQGSETDERNTGTTRLVLTTLVVVYFVSLTHLLLIAQQLSLALGNFVVALVMLALLFGETFPRIGRRSREDGENWRR